MTFLIDIQTKEFCKVIILFNQMLHYTDMYSSDNLNVFKDRINKYLSLIFLSLFFS